MNMKIALLVGGAASLVIGILIGAVHRSIPGAGGPIDCGSPWSPSDSPKNIDDFANALSGGRLGRFSGYAERCNDTLGGAGVWAGVLAILGVLVLIGVAFLQAAQQGTMTATTRGQESQDGPEASS